MTERKRVDGLRLTLGTVFKDNKGDLWIYVGQSKTKEGENACFYPAKYPESGMVWKCAFQDALAEKFIGLPDLKYGHVQDTGWGQYELRKGLHLGQPILTQHCHIETNRECGCSLGQCPKGNIY